MQFVATVAPRSPLKIGLEVGMDLVMRTLFFSQSRHTGRRRRDRSAKVIQIESLEQKTLMTALTPVADHATTVERTSSVQNSLLHQLSFLIGRWNSDVKFPNGAAAPQRQILNYRFSPDRSVIITKQVVLTSPRVYVARVVAVDPANGQILETAHDSSGRTVVQVWAPTVPGSFVITDVYQNPDQGLGVSTALSKFGRNSYIYARDVVYPDGSMQVEALSRQNRVS